MKSLSTENSKILDTSQWRWPRLFLNTDGGSKSKRPYCARNYIFRRAFVNDLRFTSLESKFEAFQPLTDLLNSRTAQGPKWRSTLGPQSIIKSPSSHTVSIRRPSPDTPVRLIASCNRKQMAHGKRSPDSSSDVLGRVKTG